MTTGMLMVFAAVSVLLPCEAFGQASSDNVIDAVRISGRIIGFAGAPVPEQTLSIRNLQAAGPPQVSTVKTNEDGRFVFAAHGHIAYEFYIVVPMSPPAFIGIGTIEAVGGVDVDMGSIVTQFSSAPEPAIDLAQQIRVAPARRSETMSSAASIALIYISSRGTVHIVLGDGKEIRPLKESEQVGCESPKISEDSRAVGWLVQSEYCCTSYPISLKLVVYRPGKPLRRFEGGRAIFGWNFGTGGKQVAYYTDFLHGNSWEHYELRDIATGRLAGKWEGDLTAKSPRWARRCKSETR